MKDLSYGGNKRGKTTPMPRGQILKGKPIVFLPRETEQERESSVHSDRVIHQLGAQGILRQDAR